VMNVLVTGGGGYIGSVLVRRLVREGYGVRVLDRFFFGEESLRDVAEEVEIVRGDVRDVTPEIFRDIFAVFDLAALSNDPAGELDPAKTLDINYLGRARIARLARHAGVARYVLASSCSIYGFQTGLLTEESPVNPLTTYAEANHLAEQAVLPLSCDSFCVTALRQATVYGLSPRMRFDLAVNGMTLGLWKNGKINVLRDGSQWRPFVHVEDTARAFLLVLESAVEAVSGQVFNVGSDEQNIRILDLAKQVATACGREFAMEWYGDPDHRSYTVSFGKIREHLGYGVEHTFADGARGIFAALEEGAIDTGERTKTVAWYRKLLEAKSLVDAVSHRGEIL